MKKNKNKKKNDMPLCFSFILLKQKWRNNDTTDVVTQKTSVTESKTSSAGSRAGSIRIGQGLTQKWKN